MGTVQETVCINCAWKVVAISGFCVFNSGVMCIFEERYIAYIRNKNKCAAFVLV